MKKNLESVAQRGEHIDQLQDKSENLNQSAQGFRRGANRVRKQMWWKNVKMRIWIIVGIIILLLLIIVPSKYPLLIPRAVDMQHKGRQILHKFFDISDPILVAATKSHH